MKFLVIGKGIELMPTDIFFRFDANFQETESLCNILCHSFSSSSFPSPMLMLLLLPLFYVFVIFDRKLISIARIEKKREQTAHPRLLDFANFSQFLCHGFKVIGG